jgi:predicted transcriptional regulator
MISQPTTTVRVPRVLIERLRTIAEAHERSVSAELRVALDGYTREALPGAKRTLRERARGPR